MSQFLFMVVLKSFETAKFTSQILVLQLELLDRRDLSGLKVLRLAHPGNEARFAATLLISS
jgi:hypothetical protein